MGEYSGLYIKGFQVDYWKNSIGFGSDLFTQADLTQTPQPYYGNEEDYYAYDDLEDEENHTSPGYQYINTAKEIKDRLEIMGFSLDGARRKFENGVVEFIEKAKDYSSKYTLEAEELKDAPIFNPFNPKAVSFFENYTFDLWSKLIRHYRK